MTSKSAMNGSNPLSQLVRRRLAWLPYLGVVGVIIFLLYHIGSLQHHHIREQQKSVLLQEIVQHSNSALIIADRWGLILSWNQGAVKLFGWTEEEALGRDIGLVIRPKDFAHHQVAFRKAIERERLATHVSVVDCYAVDRAGKEIPVRVTLRMLSNGNGVRFFALVDRLSELRILQKVSPEEEPAHELDLP